MHEPDLLDILAKDTTIDNNVILHRGSQFTQPVNINGYWTSSMFFTYGVAIEKMKCNFNLNTGFNYGRTPGMVNDVKSISSTYVPTAGFVLSSNISEAIDFTISYTGTYNVIKNTIQTSANNNYFGHTASGKFNWLFWKGFVFNTSITNIFYESSTQGFNQNIFLWNLALGYKFLKNKSLDIRASVNDVLNQNLSLSRNVSQTYIEDDRNLVLKRYLMLTVTWTLRYFKGGGGGPPTDQGERRGPPDGMPRGPRPGGGGGYGGYGN